MTSSANVFEQSSTDGVFEIILRSTPFKIVNEIIKLISVFMIYLWEILRVWYECLSDKPMNTKIGSCSVVLKCDPKVSIWRNSWFDHSHNGMVIREYFTSGCYGIHIIPSMNKLHYFT